MDQPAYVGLHGMNAAL